MYVRKREAQFAFISSLAVAVLVLSPALWAQNADPSEPGPTASELVTASSTSVSGGLNFDSSVGWNFTQHFGGDIGLPYMFNTRPGLFAGTAGRLGYVNYPYVDCTFFFGCYYGVATSSRIWTGELEDGYAEIHYARNYKKYNLLSNLTGDFPTASYRKGLTTGRFQWDWFNHVDRSFHGFDPFLNFGLANGRMDQHFLPRPFNTNLPFRTLGYMADFEGGVQYKVWRRFTIGASMWDVLPFGPQKIYSNLVWQYPGGNNILTVPSVGTSGPSGASPATTSGGGGSDMAALQRQIIFPAGFASGTAGSFGYLAGDPNHGRYWNQAFETAGPNDIARDNGYSATLGISLGNNVDLDVGYNHSVRYALDGVVVSLEFNANSLFRKLTNY
jgi:hypothetical protein